MKQPRTHSRPTKTLVSLFGCVLDFFSEIRRWVVVAPAVRAAGEAGTEESPPSTAAAPSIVDLWAMQRLGLECSRVLGVWVAEDPESLPQRFLDALPVLLALNAGVEVRRVVAFPGPLGGHLKLCGCPGRICLVCLLRPGCARFNPVFIYSEPALVLPS